ncbi:hypothetical protein [Oceanispirochaeta sp.]|jgi:peptidoglycan hydrolase CwlO-like protein|uniref:hypothetical protein n=1 Tax=Oceanispirochaeta sp. TaxID=2035350 RepID=UPI00263A3913|nr:hypothetical protein [Oceanispirochaeta sp.]MDA3957228.1 hypothetical protein [Oceanispirochaeta sp.]
MRVHPSRPITLILLLALMNLLSCSERREIRQKTLDDAGMIVMEEPELTPLVKTLLNMDEQLDSVNRSLRGEGGDFQNSLEDFDQTLGDVRDQIQDLKALLNQQEVQIREFRQDYEIVILEKENQAEMVLP